MDAGEYLFSIVLGACCCIGLSLLPIDSIENMSFSAVYYTNIREHETRGKIVCRLLLAKKLDAPYVSTD